MNTSINKVVTGIVRWGARIYAVPTYAFMAAMMIGIWVDYMFGNLMQGEHITLRQCMLACFTTTMVAGYPVGWKKELAGGIMMLLGASHIFAAARNRRLESLDDSGDSVAACRIFPGLEMERNRGIHCVLPARNC